MNSAPLPVSIPPHELHRRLQAREPGELLVVRTPGEFTAAHVPGARLVPLADLDAAAFVRQRRVAGQPIYVLCQSGGRARRAIEQLERAGCCDCVLVEGGTDAWLAAGLPVERSQSRALPLMRQ